MQFAREIDSHGRYNTIARALTRLASEAFAEYLYSSFEGSMNRADQW